MSAAVATFGKVPQTCRTCTRPESAELRRWQGCDGPAPAALFSVDCPRCAGTRHDCDLCAGAGEVPVDRCPWATMSEQVARVCEYASLIEHGVLPVEGGLEDQSDTFVTALRLVLSTRGKVEKERAERQAQPQEAAGRG